MSALLYVESSLMQNDVLIYMEILNSTCIFSVDKLSYVIAII